MTPYQEERARGELRRAKIAKDAGDYFADWFSWKRISEDVLHYYKIDNLPEDQQLAIRLRRQEEMKNSYIPWMVSDATALLTAYDDIDDFFKTSQLINEYGIQPLSYARDILGRPEGYNRNPVLQAWRRNCAKKVPKKVRKEGFRRAVPPTRFPAGLLPALLGLFPGWRFWALAFQAAQTTDGLFGIGMQLGPVIGAAMELTFRGLAYLGLPFGPEHNKYHQILGSRTLSAMPKLLAAHQALHPEDTFSVLATLDHINNEQLVPYNVIAPEDYPDVFNVISEPWQEAKNFAGLAASIPYNIGAAFANNVIGSAFQDWSLKIEGNTGPDIPNPELGNFPRWVMERIAKGLCPTDQCDAELLQALAYIAQGSRRKLILPKYPDPELSLADKLGFVIDYLAIGILT